MTQPSTPGLQSPTPPAPLVRQWQLAAVLFLVAWLLCYALLARLWTNAGSNRWLLLSGAALLHPLWLSRRHLSDNRRRQDRPPLPGFGPGNWLTLLRGLMVALMAGFLFNDRPAGMLAWLPALLYTGVTIADLFDGYLARVADHATELGAILDVETDALSVLLVTSLGIWYGNLPLIFIVLGLARYAFILGQRWRERQGKVNYPMTDSSFRRIVAGLYMSFLTVMLWPVVHPPGTYVAAAAFSLPFSAIFLRDWLVVSGSIDPTSRRYRQWWNRSARLIAGTLPPLLRLLAAGVIVAWVLDGFAVDWPGFLGIWVAGWNQFFYALTVLAALLVLVGILVHFTAIWLILAAAADILTTTLDPANGLLLFCGCLLTILGAGRLGLWSPEHKAIFLRRPGRPKNDS